MHLTTRYISLLTRTGNGGGGIYNHYNLATTGSPYTTFVFMHELGHGFGGLADEYYTSEVPYNDFYQPDAEPWEPNITTMVGFDRKWKTLLTPGVPVPTPDSLRYRDVTGVFEGGGYQAKGIYRPQFVCIMIRNRKNSFCSVCKKSIENMIRWLTE